MTRAVTLFIDGKPARAESRRTFDRINPADGTVASRSPAADVRDVRRAADAAWSAFGRWRDAAPAWRRTLLLKAADEMESAASSSWR